MNCKVSHFNRFQNEYRNFIKFAFWGNKQNMKKAKVVGLHKCLSERSRWMCTKSLSSWSSSALWECRLWGAVRMEESERWGLQWLTVVRPHNEVDSSSLKPVWSSRLFSLIPLCPITPATFPGDQTSRNTQLSQSSVISSALTLPAPLESRGRAAIAVASSQLLYKFHLYKMYHS